MFSSHRFMRRWDESKTPILRVAWILAPYNHDKSLWRRPGNSTIIHEVFSQIVRVDTASEDVAAKVEAIEAELSTYYEQSAPFHLEHVKAAAYTRDPSAWWGQYCGEMPTAQRYLIYILNVVPNQTWAEHDLTALKFVNNKLRGRALMPTASQLNDDSSGVSQTNGTKAAAVYLRTSLDSMVLLADTLEVDDASYTISELDKKTWAKTFEPHEDKVVDTAVVPFCNFVEEWESTAKKSNATRFRLKTKYERIRLLETFDDPGSDDEGEESTDKMELVIVVAISWKKGRGGGYRLETCVVDGGDVDYTKRTVETIDKEVHVRIKAACDAGYNKGISLVSLISPTVSSHDTRTEAVGSPLEAGQNSQPTESTIVPIEEPPALDASSTFTVGTSAVLRMSGCVGLPQLVLATRVDGGWEVTAPWKIWLHPHNANAFVDVHLDGQVDYNGRSTYDVLPMSTEPHSQSDVIMMKNFLGSHAGPSALGGQQPASQAAAPLIAQPTTPAFHLNDPNLEALRVEIWNNRILGNPQHLTMDDPQSSIHWNNLTHQMMIDEAYNQIRSLAVNGHEMFNSPKQICLGYLFGFEIMQGGSWANVAHHLNLQ